MSADEAAAERLRAFHEMTVQEPAVADLAAPERPYKFPTFRLRPFSQ